MYNTIIHVHRATADQNFVYVPYSASVLQPIPMSSANISVLQVAPQAHAAAPAPVIEYIMHSYGNQIGAYSDIGKAISIPLRLIRGK